MAKSNDWVCVGVIAGAHGVRGDVKVRSFTQHPEDCLSYGPLHDETGRLLIDPVNVRMGKDHFIVSQRGSTTREDWEAMKGTRLFVPRDALPEPDEDEFYYDDLLNLEVVHLDGRTLGRVKSVQNFGSDDLLEIVAPDRKTAYFLPFTREVIPVLRMAEGQLLADPAEAYLPDHMQLRSDEDEAGPDPVAD